MTATKSNKYQKILSKIEKMEPGEVVQIQHPQSNPYDRALDFFCEITRCDEDEIKSEYEYLEYGEGCLYPDTYFTTDNSEEMADKVIKYLK